MRPITLPTFQRTMNSTAPVTSKRHLTKFDIAVAFAQNEVEIAARRTDKWAAMARMRANQMITDATTARHAAQVELDDHMARAA